MTVESFDPNKALVPVDTAADERRVRHGFRKKIARVAAKIPFAADAVAAYYAARDPETPRKTKALILAGLSYFVLPADAIPDIFAGVGFTDDAAVIAAMLALVGGSIRARHREAAQGLLQRLST